MRVHRLPLVLVLVVAACASDDASSGGGSGSRATRAAADETPGPPPTSRTFSPETQEFMKSALRQFSAQDPRWETTRRAWLDLGQRESEFLVQTMWEALVTAQDANAPQLVERARHELALIGAPSVPLLCEVLAAGTRTMTDPQTDKPRTVALDDGQRREAAEILAIIGAPAAGPTIDALRRAETKGGRRFALQALGNMGDRGGAAAADTVTAYARDTELVLRVEAIHGLRNFKDQATLDALVAALSDEEDVVRTRAAESLVARRAASAVPALRAAAATARARAEGHVGEGFLEESRRLDRAADAIEKPRRK